MTDDLAEARAALAEIREIVGGLDGESTLNAVRDMATEWEHYSREMHRAGYETIPRLTTERDEARAALAEERATRERLAEAGDELYHWLEVWVSEHPDVTHCYSEAALTAWRVLAAARSGQDGEG